MSNPFESIAKGIFQNRAALKMANIDSVFDFMFTNPKDENNKSLVRKSEPLYFADVFGGPGGCSEYVLWKKGWQAKGFGFTPKGENDFKLNEFFGRIPETFEPHYGVNGVSGNGNIYDQQNFVEFRDFVLCNTNKKGVHFVVADGAFSVKGQQNIQEILSKRLYLCKFMYALSILRTGGHFVCNVFDTFTPFSVGLIYLLYKCFRKIAIHKPNSSRPANSERYIICKWKRPDTERVEIFLCEMNIRLNSMHRKNEDDITELVSMDVLIGDQPFFNYICNSIENIGKRQIHFLLKVKAFAENQSLKEARKEELKKQCLAYWKVSKKSLVIPQRSDSHTMFRQLMERSPAISNKKN
ncbi:hypothetical protein B4U80_02025 [Leptotrombidium deliense]|uniref:Cap-specific mRNA (nucleoside-2'-O-)-methyltransferase 1 n=1 Tax=Leptotrombidium deliense TaxID=299467 RepID=A0A443RVV8_9ACAR|nr:hypothetical protein B4U80_02025 [Leptotrombidium deliense]